MIALKKTVEEKSSSFLKNIKELIKDKETSVLKVFKRPLPTTSRSKPSSPVEASNTDFSEDEDEGELYRDSSSSCGDEATWKPLAFLEDTDILLKDIRATMKFNDCKEHKSIQDIMFWDLGHKSFPP